jgi:hypothetical protein
MSPPLAYARGKVALIIACLFLIGTLARNYYLKGLPGALNVSSICRDAVGQINFSKILPELRTSDVWTRFLSMMKASR